MKTINTLCFTKTLNNLSSSQLRKLSILIFVKQRFKWFLLVIAQNIHCDVTCLKFIENKLHCEQIQAVIV